MTKKAKAQHLLTFRIPATEDGYDLVKQMRRALNKDSYKMRTLFTGKRPTNHTAFTLKKDAESIRVYIESIIEGNVSSEVEKQIYESGIVTGKAREQFDNEERLNKAIDYTKKLLDKIVAKDNDLKVANGKVNALKKQYLALDENSKNDMDLRQREIDRLNTFNGLLKCKDSCECEGSCVSQEDYDEALELKASMREEIIALNNSLSDSYKKLSDLDKEFKDLQKRNYCLLDNNNVLQVELDTLRECHSKLEESVYVKKAEDFTDMSFDKWMETQPWNQRLMYKIASITWRDMAMILFATWTISMVVVLILKVEGVIN